MARSEQQHNTRGEEEERQRPLSSSELSLGAGSGDHRSLGRLCVVYQGGGGAY